MGRLCRRQFLIRLVGRQQMRVILASLLALVLSACGITAPVKVAETPQQKAYALEGTYNVFLGAAVDLVENPEVPADVKRVVFDAERVATDTVDAMRRAYAEVQVIQIALDEAAKAAKEAATEAGRTAAEAEAEAQAARLAAATLNLEDWLDRVEKAIADLAAAVKGEVSTGPTPDLFSPEYV